MKKLNFKTAAIYCLSILCLSIFIISCSENDDTEVDKFEALSIQAPMEKVQDALDIDDEISVSNRSTLCFELLGQIQFNYGDECAAVANQLLSNAYNNFFKDKSDYNVYLMLYYQIYYWGVLVECDSENECENCASYLETAQSFAACLIGSPYEGGLAWIIEFLEQQCANCPPTDDCCPGASISAVMTKSEEGCCEIEVTYVVPEGCTKITPQFEGFRIQGKLDCDYSTVYADSEVDGVSTVVWTFCCKPPFEGIRGKISFFLQLEECEETLYTKYLYPALCE